MVLGQNWNLVVEWISQYQKLALVVIGVMVVLFIEYKLHRQQRQQIAVPTKK